MKRLVSHNEFVDFKEKYKRLSGFDVPLNYIKENKVYGHYSGLKLQAGFIIGKSSSSLRTIESFVSRKEKSTMYKSLGDLNNYCEVTCFWMSRETRKNKVLNAWIWIQMGLLCTIQDKPLVLYGTNSKGLARIYGLPEKSNLIHQETIQTKACSVFLAKRGHILSGTLIIIWSRISRRHSKSALKPILSLQTILSNDLPR